MMTQKNNLLFGGVLLSLLALTACSNVKEAIGIGGGKKVPDEFNVVSRAPLTVPPAYNLRPPAPGQPDLVQQRQKEQAKQTLLGNNTQPRNRLISGQTPGESALLRRAGASGADPKIREQILKDNQAISEQETILDDILFWKERPTDATVIDAEGERQRLQENVALGKEATDGTVPTKKKRIKGTEKGVINQMLDGVF